MTNDNLLYVMTAFVVVASVAIVIQTGLLIGMYRASRAMRIQITILVTKLEPVLGTSQRLLEEVRRYAGEISGKANEVLDLSRKQLDVVDDFLADAAARARAQMDRIEMVLDDTVNRFQETTSLLQNEIVRPLRQLHALSSGIRAALSFLGSGRRTTIEHATHDEEMFI
ncbi:MAG: hypothetical protein ABSD27_05280 [Bryobacteraceae bacterium]|jgi:ABC-type transporter Mla subunit MlaD